MALVVAAMVVVVLVFVAMVAEVVAMVIVAVAMVVVVVVVRHSPGQDYPLAEPLPAFLGADFQGSRLRRLAPGKA